MKVLTQFNSNLKTRSILKLFVIWFVSLIFLFLIIEYCNWKAKSTYEEIDATASKRRADYKYILFWSPDGFSEDALLVISGWKGYTKVCSRPKCIVTDNIDHLDDITHYDYIVFFGDQLKSLSALPARRSPNQIYIFACFLHPEKCRFCQKKYNNFFNLTWTYRLKSDKQWYNIIIRERETGTFVGPKKRMVWDIDLYGPNRKSLKQIEFKTKTALFFEYNCNEKTPRRILADKLHRELTKFNLSLDIIQVCKEDFVCINSEVCNKIVSEYYFYLAFEKYFYEDYVSNELLIALKNDVVPVVFGGANYNDFMLDGTFLDAKHQYVSDIAARMSLARESTAAYANYLRWTRLYTYESGQHTRHINCNPICSLCRRLKYRKLNQTMAVYKNFIKYWNGPNACEDFVRLSEFKKTCFFAASSAFVLLWVARKMCYDILHRLRVITILNKT